MPENHTEESDVAVRQRFGEIAGSAFDTVIASERLPSGWSLLLRRLREKLVQLASELWERILAEPDRLSHGQM